MEHYANCPMLLYADCILILPTDVGNRVRGEREMSATLWDVLT